MGLYYDKRRDNWVARITIDKKRVFLGSFETERMALKAYLRAELMHEMQKYFTIENAKVDYLEADTDIARLDAFRRLKLEKVAKQLRRVYIAAVVILLKRSRKRHGAKHD